MLHSKRQGTNLSECFVTLHHITGTEGIVNHYTLGGVLAVAYCTQARQ